MTGPLLLIAIGYGLIWLGCYWPRPRWRETR